MAQNEDAHDLITQLPSAIRESIFSLLSLKEAAATSIICHRWQHMWESSTRTLDFSDGNQCCFRVLCQETREHKRRSYVDWADKLVEQHTEKHFSFVFSDVPMLVEVSLLFDDFTRVALSQLSCCHSQLETLRLNARDRGLNFLRGISVLPALTSLKHFELEVNGLTQIILIITILNETAVALEKIVIDPMQLENWSCYHVEPDRREEKSKRPRDHAMHQLKRMVPSTIEFVCL
ncbi:hypothetical protein ACLB2K_076987 [Fragaria x ananassa]